MIELKLITAIFQGLPEATAMAAVVCALIGRRFDWKKIFAVGFLQIITIYLIRLLPVTLGIHIFLGIFTLALYTQTLIKDRFIRVIKSSILAYMMLAALETAVYISILNVLHISQVEASHNLLFWILMGWPQVVGMFVIAYLINRIRNRKEEVDNTGGL